MLKVKSTARDIYLEGKYFDIRLVKHLIEEFKRKHKQDPSQNKSSLKRLRTAAENARRTLSSAAPIEIDSLYQGVDFYSSISRTRFEDLFIDLFRSTLQPVTIALKDAHWSKSDIHEVALVGGSTRIPKIRNLLDVFFNGKQLNCSIIPDKAVAYGAAVQAAVLAKVKDKAINDVHLVDVVLLSLEIETAGGLMTKLDEINTKVLIRLRTLSLLKPTTSQKSRFRLLREKEQ